MIPLALQTERPDMVKVISLEDQDETVKRFFELLVCDPADAVVELNGHRVYLIVRPATPPDQTDELWTDAKSHCRAELVTGRSPAP